MPESNSSTEKGFVVGRLGRPHGLDGFLGLYADESEIAHFDPGKTVSIEDRPYQVRAVRRTDRGFQVQFENVSTREAAEQIRGQDIIVGVRRQLGDDEYWPEQLAGLLVRDETGRQIGVVKRWVPGSAQDRLAIEVDGSEFEVPFVAEFVPSVVVDEGYLEIRPIPGLIEPLA